MTNPHSNLLVRNQGRVQYTLVVEGMKVDVRVHEQPVRSSPPWRSRSPAVRSDSLVVDAETRSDAAGFVLCERSGGSFGALTKHSVRSGVFGRGGV